MTAVAATQVSIAWSRAIATASTGPAQSSGSAIQPRRRDASLRRSVGSTWSAAPVTASGRKPTRRGGRRAGRRSMRRPVGELGRRDDERGGGGEPARQRGAQVRGDEPDRRRPADRGPPPLTRQRGRAGRARCSPRGCAGAGRARGRGARRAARDGCCTARGRGRTVRQLAEARERGACPGVVVLEVGNLVGVVGAADADEREQLLLLGLEVPLELGA